MAANGFRCRFVASAIASAYDRPGGFETRAWTFSRAGSRLLDPISIAAHRLGKGDDIGRGRKETTDAAGNLAPRNRRNHQPKLLRLIEKGRVRDGGIERCAQDGDSVRRHAPGDHKQAAKLSRRRKEFVHLAVAVSGEEIACVLRKARLDRVPGRASATIEGG